MNWFQITSKIVIPAISAMVTIGATLVAVWGIRAWRREYVGKRRIDLAEEVLSLVYESKEFYDAVRSSIEIEREGEGSSRQKSPDETEAETMALNQAFIQIERCNNRPDLFAKLRSLRYRFMAQNGRDAGKLLEELSNVRHKISKPYRKLRLRIKYLRKHSPERDSVEYKNDLKQICEEIEREIDGFDDETPDAEDVVLRRVDQLVAEIEKICVNTIGNRK
jgi:hypothetical protein